jgi:hypothetical protein
MGRYGPNHRGVAGWEQGRIVEEPDEQVPGRERSRGGG